jgi:hypothetical protein
MVLFYFSFSLFLKILKFIGKGLYEINRLANYFFFAGAFAGAFLAGAFLAGAFLGVAIINMF